MTESVDFLYGGGGGLGVFIQNTIRTCFKYRGFFYSLNCYCLWKMGGERIGEVENIWEGRVMITARVREWGEDNLRLSYM